MPRKLHLHRETIRQLTRNDAAAAVGAMPTPAIPWTPVIPATASQLIRASIEMCTAWGMCVTGQCSDACGPDTSPVTACACLPTDAPGAC